MQDSEKSQPEKPSRGKKRPPKKVTADWLHNAGLHYLQRFACSRSRFRSVMTRKIDRSCRAHPDQDRESCLSLLDALTEKFERLGLLDDRGYARAAAATLRRRGYSRQAVLARLSAKGLSSALAGNALEECDGENRAAASAGRDPEIVAALRLARRKKIGPFAVREKDFDKALAALGRAGFDYETARTALRMDAAEAGSALAERD